MTITANRNDEPTVGLLGLFGGKKPTPAKLVENAFASFQKAQEEMTAAQEAIKAEQEAHTKAAADSSAKAAECAGHYERLARVNNRLTDLLA